MGDFVKTTQESLGKLIKKPPLTEKLLRKPPFRFLHDIITEVIRTTSFMKGLYSATDMDSQNVKDKESKIAFLQKAIDVVALVLKKPVSVKPSKIVAGHEPDRTNELLQQIASAISKKLDSSEAVAQVLKGTRNEPESSKPPRPAKEDEKIRDSSADKKRRDKDNRDKKSSSDNRDRSSSRDREKGRDKEPKERDRSKDRDRHRDRSKDKNKETDRSGSKDRERDRSKDKERKGRDKEKGKEQDKERDRDREKDRGGYTDGERERSKDKDHDRDNQRDRERKEKRKRKEDEESARPPQQNGSHEGEEDARPAPLETEDGASTNRIPRPTSAKGQRRRPLQGSDDIDGPKAGRDDRSDMVNGSDSLPPQVQASRKMARPSSARPAPPRVTKPDAAEDPAMRIGSGKQVAHVIVDNGQTSEDEDDTFVVEESHPEVNGEPQVLGSDSLEDDGEHGGLVKKILETKKELEGNKAGDKKADKPIVIDAARRKERERVQREVEKLTTAIQTLTRSANPLGKIMDYLQEDVDSMQKELEMWKTENQEHTLAIKLEQGITDTELEPLKAQLTELDQGIEDQLGTIATIKSNLLRGEEKIAKMVSTVAIS